VHRFTNGCTFCIEDYPFDKKEYLDIKNRFERINAKLERKEMEIKSVISLDFLDFFLIF